MTSDNVNAVKPALLNKQSDASQEKEEAEDNPFSDNSSIEEIVVADGMPDSQALTPAIDSVIQSRQLHQQPGQSYSSPALISDSVTQLSYMAPTVKSAYPQSPPRLADIPALHVVTQDESPQRPKPPLPPRPSNQGSRPASPTKDTFFAHSSSQPSFLTTNLSSSFNINPFNSQNSYVDSNMNLPSLSTSQTLAVSPNASAATGTSSSAPPLPARPAAARKAASAETLNATDTQIPTMDERIQAIHAKEQIVTPAMRFVDRGLPVPETLPTTELFHKGSVRAFAFSGFHAVTCQSTVRSWFIPSGTETGRPVQFGADAKVTACCFVPSRALDINSRSFWVAVDKGELVDVNAETGDIIERRSVHNATVTHILRHMFCMYTLDENGGLKVWQPDASTGRISLSMRPRGLRVNGRITCCIVVGSRLWTAYMKQIEVYNLTEGALTLVEKKMDLGLGVGFISSITCLLRLNEIYTGHDDGKISVFNAVTFEKKRIVQIAYYRIVSLVAVGDSHLWAGFGTGKILICDVASKQPSSTESRWSVIKEFNAYLNSSVSTLFLDEDALALIGRLYLASVSESGHIRFWDGMLSNMNMSQMMRSNESSFCQYEPMNIVMLTWNIDSRKPADMDSGDSEDRDFLHSFISSHSDMDIFVVGFQELVDLESKSETARQLFKGASSGNNTNQSNVDQRQRIWQDRLYMALQDAIPGQHFAILESTQLVGLFQCVFVRAAIRNLVSNVGVSVVKTGLGGYHGNKGAISTRFLCRDTSLCFINCHLAAHQSHVSARNNDVAHILKEVQFPKHPQSEDTDNNVGCCIWVDGGDGSMALDHEIVFWSGDLNYRIDMTRQQVLERIEAQDWQTLWENDQLLKQKQSNISFGLSDFQEGPMVFPPTFKYNRNTQQYDSSDKMRIPAYCDRILWRNGVEGRPETVTQTSFTRGECKISDHRPVMSNFRVQVKRVDEQKRDAIARNVRAALMTQLDASMKKAQLLWVMNALRIDEDQAAVLLEQCGYNLKLI